MCYVGVHKPSLKAFCGHQSVLHCRTSVMESLQGGMVKGQQPVVESALQPTASAPKVPCPNHAALPEAAGQQTRGCSQHVAA